MAFAQMDLGSPALLIEAPKASGRRTEKRGELPGEVEEALRDAAIAQESPEQLQQRWKSGLRNSEMILQELQPGGSPHLSRITASSEVTFDEVVTARKERSQKNKRKQMRFMLLPGSTQLNLWRGTMVAVVPWRNLDTTVLLAAPRHALALGIRVGCFIGSERPRCVAIERLRKQPEMADGMMECPKPKDPKPQRQDSAISSRSSSSQDTSSEEWNPHTEETEVNLNAAAEIEPEPSQVRRSRSLSWGQLREGIQGPQLKRLMTCRTEVFRRPHIFQRRDARCIDPLIEPMELVNTMHTGVGHAGRRASMRIAQESQEVGSNHGTPRMLFALHKVENGMNNLLTRMNTMEKSMSSNRSAEPVKPGKAAEAG
ncbi:unnamed protein product [Effrenium voratum]|nr:unnamed protein product [Effrenium voratum]